MARLGAGILFAMTFGVAALDVSAWNSDWSGLLKPSEQPVLAQVAAEDPQTVAARESAQPQTAEKRRSSEPRKAFYITPDDILQAVQADLRGRFGLEGELVLIPDREISRIPVPDESWQVEITPPFPPDLGSRMHIRFRVSNGYEHQAPEVISLRAEWWRESYVARRLVRPGSLDAGDAWSIETVNWLQHRGALVPAEHELSNLRLKSAWRAGEPLRWSIVETRPMVQTGKVVDVVAQEGSLRITMRGVAMQNGNAGDLINVRNLQSRQEIQGVVSDAKTVLVVF